MWHTVAYMPEYITVWCFGSMAIWIYGLWSKNCKRMGLDTLQTAMTTKALLVLKKDFIFQGNALPNYT